MKYTLGLVVVLSASLALEAEAASRRLVVDHAGSTVTFFVRPTVDSFVGTVENWEANVTVPDGTRLPDNAEFSTTLGELKTGKDARDREMLHWLDEASHPHLKYHLTAINQSADGSTEAAGELTFHGVTMPVTIPLTITDEGGTYTVVGEVTIDYQDFGLKIFRKFAILSVRPEVKVSFTVTGTLQ